MNKENLEAYALGAAGAVQGVYRYYLQPELTAKRGWLAIGALVAAYEFACPKDELLSQGVDRAMEEHPILTRAAIGVTALHLMNLLPEKVDPFHQAVEFLRG